MNDNNMNEFEKRYEKFGCIIKPIELIQSIRINTLKISEEKLVKRLKSEKIELEKILWLKNGYYVSSSFSVGSTSEYLQGYYYIQEAASQFPVEILNPEKNEMVLDMSAAPGGKTTQIAQMMENTGKIIAIDIKTDRLNALKNNLERMGITNTIIYRKDSRYINDFNIEFDKILLDAPCSGNYVIEKEFFEKRTIEGFLERQNLQKELLKAAIKVLKKNGTLVYSTCSLEPEENEIIIQWLLERYNNLKLEKIDYKIGNSGLTEVFGKKINSEIEKCKRFWPNKTNTQGFFVAKIRKY